MGGTGKICAGRGFSEIESLLKSKLFHTEIIAFIIDAKIHKATADQLFRASLSIPLHIAEGSGRLIAKDRRNLFIIVRSQYWHKFENLRQQGEFHTKKPLSHKPIITTNHPNKLYNLLWSESLMKMLPKFAV